MDMTRTALDILASSYFNLPPASDTKKEVQVKRMLQTRHARMVQPESGERDKLLVQSPDDCGNWIKDAQKGCRFTFLNANS